MSINDFMNKIKGQIGIDRNTLLILVILILVGLGSFGLGRLERGEDSKNSDSKLENENASFVKGVTGESLQTESNVKNIENISKEKMYVASKNGKLYYKSGCSGAKRISAKNEIWWSSEQEAIDAGYNLSTSCK